MTRSAYYMLVYTTGTHSSEGENNCRDPTRHVGIGFPGAVVD